MRSLVIVIAFAIVPVASHAGDRVVPKSSAIRSLIPDLQVLVGSEAIDLNAISKDQIGVTVLGGKAYATPQIEAKLLPKGYSVLPLEFFLDRGDASALRSGDRVVCRFVKPDGSVVTCLKDATVVARSIPLAKDAAGLYLDPSARRPATHRSFTFLVRDADKKLFWDTLTHGGCSFGGALVPIMPFMMPGLSGWSATVVAVVFSLTVLFGLGVYAGVMTRENLIFAGLKMMMVGIVVAVFIWAIEFSGLI